MKLALVAISILTVLSLFSCRQKEQGPQEQQAQAQQQIQAQEQVNVGDVIAFEGKISLNKDFGAGYAYDVLMEEAKRKT